VLLVIYSSADVGIVLFIGYSFSEVEQLCFLLGTDLLKWIYCFASDVNERIFFSCLIIYFSCSLHHTNSRRGVTFSKEEC
jgi:hypothetical protein